jgi:hypothetical protein
MDYWEAETKTVNQKNAAGKKLIPREKLLVLLVTNIGINDFKYNEKQCFVE